MADIRTMVSAPLGVAGDYPSHFASLGKGGVHVFSTIKERDAMGDDLKDISTIAIVGAGENGYPSFYKWENDKWNFEGYFGGSILADVDGALSKKVDTIVFGEGFSIQEAGDQGNGALVQYTPPKGTGGSSDLTVTMTPQTQYGASDVQKIRTETPLMVADNPDEQHSVKMYIQHDAFEPMHKPSFLAYLDENEDVVGKIGEDRGHHDGRLWFGDVVKPAGAYIQVDKENKAYGIQEADNLDPNISGGTDYLVAFRVHMKGKAPNDGMVRAYLYNDPINSFSEKGILLDTNGHPMAVERHYKQGEELGSLDVIGVVNAKGIQNFTCHVVDDFADDMLVLTDRTQGCTGLMIQAITSEEKTGLGLLQFENDTKQNINFSSHYLGPDRASLGYWTSRDSAMETGDAGHGMTMTDGFHFYNLSRMQTGVQDGHLVFQDDGSAICDFNFGKIFTAEETKLLRGSEIDVKVTLTDKNCGWVIGLVKWTGTPDQYTTSIYKSRNNGTPVFEKGWELAGSAGISEDVVVGDHQFAHTFSVPADANNYGVIIYPVEAQQPMTLKLSQFEVDVSTPFIGYAIKAPDLLNEMHLEWNDEYKNLVQNTQGYASLRYTINASELPMPCGELGKGAADVSLDTTVNQVTGSQARGGEGAIKFNTDGNAKISTQLNLWNEQGSDNLVKFWWAKVSDDGQTYTKIVQSERDATVKAGSKGTIFNMPTFPINVKAGDRIALRAQAGKADAAFLQCVSDAKPMVDVDVKFKELVAVP